MGAGLGAFPQRCAQRGAQTGWGRGGCIRPFGVRVHGESGGGGTNPVPTHTQKRCKAFGGGVRLPLLASVAAREAGRDLPFAAHRPEPEQRYGERSAAVRGRHAANPPNPPGLPRLLPAARPRPAPPGSQPPPPPLLSPPLFSPSSPGKSEVSC